MQQSTAQRSTWMIQSGVRPMRSILSRSFAFASASSISVSACTAAIAAMLIAMQPQTCQDFA